MFKDFLLYLISYIAITGVLYTLFYLFKNKHNKLKNKHNSLHKTLIFSTLIWLVVAYWYPSMRLYDSMHVKIDKKNVYLTNPQKEFMQAEFEKVKEEIAENSMDNKRWFYYKMVLVGALVGAILSQVLKNRNSDNKKLREQRYEFMDIIGQKFFMITVGLGFILAVIIDIQVRQNMLVTNQLGGWIAHQYEPIMNNAFGNEDSLRNNDNNTIVDLNDDSLNFCGWETYLRQSAADTIYADIEKIDSLIKQEDKFYDNSICKKIKLFFKSKKLKEARNKKFVFSKNGDINIIRNLKSVHYYKNNFKLSNSTHTDIFYSLFHFPAFHLLTWLLYAFFLCSFYHFIQKNILHNKKSLKGFKQKYRLSLNFIFLSVHMIILFFSVLSRSQSGVFEMKYSIFSPCLYSIPVQSAFFNMLVTIFFVILPNALYYYKYIQNRYLND